MPSHQRSLNCTFQTISTSKANVLAQVKLRIRQRLDEVCGGSDTLGTGLSCNVADLEAICREVRMEMMLETNEILKRRRKRGEVGHAGLLYLGFGDLLALT